jgi:hypothetical protein
MASARRKSSSSGPSASGKKAADRPKRPARSANGSVRSVSRSAQQHFAVCVRNDDYAASLELRKLYVVIDDSFAAEHQMIRIIDESGEDYLYPSSYFVRVELPRAVELTLQKIA